LTIGYHELEKETLKLVKNQIRVFEQMFYCETFHNMGELDNFGLISLKDCAIFHNKSDKKGL